MEEVLKYFPTPDGEAVEIAREVKEEKLWTSRQHAQVMALVRKGCANYIAEYKECGYTDGYGCVLETSPCPMSSGRIPKNAPNAARLFRPGATGPSIAPSVRKRQRKSNTESGSVNIWVKDDGLGFQKPRFYAAFQP